ncbi:MAG: DUF4912 domain-containing protein [Nitrospinota bacterium]|nr:DUF4912 domain-containing protein [Nitrospinota bacterium]
MTKSELLKKTKADLLKLAQAKFKLPVDAKNTKEEIVSAILKKSGKPSIKKGAKSQVSAKKVKSTSKKTAGAKKTAKKTAKSVKASAKAKPVISSIEDVPLTKPQLPHEQAITESKYHVAERQEHLEYTNGLPDRYQDNRIVLLVRDPFWLYTFWDINPDEPGRIASEKGVDLRYARTVLRVYDVTNIIFTGGNAHSFYDIDVGSINGTWYLNVKHDDCSYLVEIGLLDPQGYFYPMARSNGVTTPRASASSRMDEQWMIADEEFWRIYGLSGGFSTVGSSQELTEAMRKRLMETVSSGGHSQSGE